MPVGGVLPAQQKNATIIGKTDHADALWDILERGHVAPSWEWTEPVCFPIINLSVRVSRYAGREMR